VHSLGVLHRDIKPANILLVPVRPGEPLRPKLTDFGIARMMDGTRLTATGTMVGTAAYLSPEQSRGADLGPASDIYSLGLVLLECIKGEIEYPGGAVESAVARLHRAPAIPGSVPPEWAALIRAMTALDPLDRPSAADLEKALRQALVSPGSLPGTFAEETTRVLPAPPPHPPTLAPATPETSPGRLDAEAATGGSSGATRSLPVLDPDAVTAAPARQGSMVTRTAARFRGARRRTRLLMSLALLAVVAAGAAGTIALTSPEPADVVTYPAVTGDLGQHLQELQKSVEP
jgi:serine/threonine protein kinase